MSTTVTYATIATNQVVNGQSDVYWYVPGASANSFYAVNIIASTGKLTVVNGSYGGDFSFDINNPTASAITYDVVLMTVSNDGSTAENHTASLVK